MTTPRVWPKRTSDEWKVINARKKERKANQSRKKTTSICMKNYVSQLLDDGLLEIYNDTDEPSDCYTEYVPVDISTPPKKISSDNVEISTKITTESIVKSIINDLVTKVANEMDPTGSESDTDIKIEEKKEKITKKNDTVSYYSYANSGRREWNEISYEDNDNKDKILTKMINGVKFYNRQQATELTRGKFIYKWSNYWFTSTNNVSDMCRCVNKSFPNSRRYHEVCYEKIKLFADLDKYLVSDQEAAVCMIKLLDAVFRDLECPYKLDTKSVQFQVNTGTKKSMHFVYNSGLVFKVNHHSERDPTNNIHDSQVEFWMYVIKYLFSHKDIYPELFYIDDKGQDASYIDMAVYNNFHPIRMAYSVKEINQDNPDPEPDRYFRPAKTMKPNITYYSIPKTCKIPNILKSNVVNDPSCDRYYDFGIYPEAPIYKDIQYDTLDEKKIRDAIEEKCPGMSISSISGGLITLTRYKDDVCPFSGIVHKISDAYVVSYREGLYYFCRSPRCQEPRNKDDIGYTKNAKGSWGVFLKTINVRYGASATTILNRPIQKNNWKAKHQDIHPKYESKELYFADWSRMVDRIESEEVLASNGEKWDGKSDSDTLTVFTKESQNMWKQWLDQTIIHISNGSRGYFLIKERIYNEKTRLESIAWNRAEEKNIFWNIVNFKPLFDIYSSTECINVGLFIKFSYSKSMIKRYDNEYWIPYDIRNKPEPPFGYNTFTGFRCEVNGQKRLELRQHSINTDKKKKKDTPAHKQLLLNLSKNEHNLNSSKEDMKWYGDLWKKEVDELKIKMEKALKLPNPDNDNMHGYAEQENYRSKLVEKENTLDNIEKYAKVIDDINIKLSEYEEDDKQDKMEDDWLDESKNKKFLKSKMYKHLAEACCDRDEKLLKWTLQYFAHMVQKPEDKPPVCLLWYSDQGAGKDTLCTWLSYLIGEESFIMTGDIQHFTKDFNAAYENKLVTAFNEVNSAKVMNIADILKHLFAADTKRIERKFVDAKIGSPCFSRFIINTNHEHTVKIPTNDRRFVMYKWNNDRCQQGKVDRKYYDELWSEVINLDDQIDAFQFFKHYDISDFNLRDIPDTKYKKQEREFNLDSVNQMILKMYDINTFDDCVGKWLKPHIRNKKKYMEDTYEDDEVDFNPDDWKFDYEFEINHLWEFYRNFCDDAGISLTFMKNKKSFLSQIGSYRVGEKLNKKTNKMEAIYITCKRSRPKCVIYNTKKLIKAYRFTPEILKTIIVDQLRVDNNEPIDEEMEEVLKAKKIVKKDIVLKPAQDDDIKE